MPSFHEADQQEIAKALLLAKLKRRADFVDLTTDVIDGRCVLCVYLDKAKPLDMRGIPSEWKGYMVLVRRCDKNEDDIVDEAFTAFQEIAARAARLLNERNASF